MEERRRRFEQLVLPHLDAAYNLARWLDRASTGADDVVQEAVLRAYRAFDGFRGGDARPWLLAIVRNCHFSAVSRARRQAAEPLEGLQPEALTAPEPDPEAVAVEADRARRLNTLIAALPVEFRETLILREMEELTYREIAEVMGVPVGTVMSRLARARALLRERWLEHSGEVAP